MRNTKNGIRVLLACLLALVLPAQAQLPAPNAAGVSTGHVHLMVPDPAAYVNILRSFGGTVVTEGSPAMVMFPGIYIRIGQRDGSTPSIETSANHIGFSVNDYSEYKALLEAAGASFFYDSEENGQILADLPEGLRVEILADEDQQQPIVFHHMHLVASELEQLQQWYIQVFGAEAGERRGLPSALVPGGRVDIMGARGEAPAGSSGGTIDHIGFEVADMDAFAAHLRAEGIEFDVPPRRLDGTEVTIAFLTDPAGTYIEVTEGLSRL